jgi:hypothetical protein
VTFLAGFAYATSLGDHSLIKIDPKACAIVSKVGRGGWGPGRFLWPTSVAVWDKHAIAVSDAHTGLISIYNADTLEFIRDFGGNGPGQNGLNMLYGLAVVDRSVFVTSTFGNRIDRFDKATGEVVETWAKEEEWKTIEDGYPYSINREVRKAYVNKHAVLTINGSCYHPGYAALVSCDGGVGIKLPPLHGSYMYFIQFAEDGDRILIFSPQCPTALLVRKGDWLGKQEVNIGLDHWLIHGKAVGPSGPVQID